MPYKDLSEINPDLKGIRPRITLEQANLIASWADANEKNQQIGQEKAWPYAIAAFKKAYTVRKGKWVKREDEKMKQSESNQNPSGEISAKNVETPAGEMYADISHPSYVPYGITSLAALKAQREASELSEGLNEAVSDFVSILNNITSAPELPDKIGSMQSLWGEFMSEVEDLLAAPPVEETQPEQNNLVELAESEPLGAIELVEAEAGKPDLLYMDVQVIRPGWGNTRDNNYYPREMLQRDAAKFVGAKMYESDHGNDKTTRNWVSTIAEIKSFTGEGAPVARVAVHDPDFAQRLRNLKAAGLLEKMECSILASGSARPFEMAGRKGKTVEGISEVSSVDWVTRAGAGGKALSLAENQGGDPVSESQAKPEPTPASIETPAQEIQTPAADAIAPAPVVIHEEQPKVLAAEEVKKLLETSNLPEVSRARLGEATYQDANELTSAIAKEREYVKLLTGSGRPFGMAESAAQKPATLEEVEKAKDAVIQKYLNK